jgi:cobalt/nickel transport system ATP-binding protein
MYDISIQNLGFTYDDGTRAIDGITLDIAFGESVGIAGGNGAGKSTLVHHLNGYFIPQQGSVSINETVLTKKTQEAIRKIAGLVFQNADDQLFMSRVYDDIMFGPQNMGIKGDALTSLVDKTINELGLCHLKDKTPSRLSAGQKRFCAFATVLVMQPKILIMDEPTSDLDPRHRRLLMELVRRLDITKITVSHDLDFIWDTCERTIIINGGRVVADGLTKDVLSNEGMLQENGLELPLRLQK